MGDDITTAIEGLTRRVHAYRVFESFKRGELDMPPLIEIKGLASAIAGAKKGIADVRAASASLNDSSTALVSELKDVTAQIESARADLKFEASTLGNGGETVSEPPPKPAPPPVPAPEAAPASQQAGSTASIEPLR